MGVLAVRFEIFLFSSFLFVLIVLGGLTLKGRNYVSPPFKFFARFLFSPSFWLGVSEISPFSLFSRFLFSFSTLGAESLVASHFCKGSLFLIISFTVRSMMSGSESVSSIVFWSFSGGGGGEVCVGEGGKGS